MWQVGCRPVCLILSGLVDGQSNDLSQSGGAVVVNWGFQLVGRLIVFGYERSGLALLLPSVALLYWVIS